MNKDKKADTEMLPPPGDPASAIVLRQPEPVPKEPVEERIAIEEHRVREGHVNVPAPKNSTINVFDQKAYIYDTVKVHKQWGIGHKCTRSEYLAAVAEALSIGVG